MNEEMNDDIIQCFIQESREFIEQLEPSIIELNKISQDAVCWDVMECENTQCPRFKKNYDIPCWLHTGFINNGTGICIHSKSKQDCLSCAVFELINGESEIINSLFRPLHSMKGTAGFLEFNSIVEVVHVAETLLDLIRSGGIRFLKEHINLLCQAIDFVKEALDQLDISSSDSELAEQSKNLAMTIQRAIDDAYEKYNLSKKDVLENKSSTTNNSSKKNNKNIDKSGYSKIESKDKSASDLTIEITKEMIDAFVVEADEMLQQIEKNLFILLESPDDVETISELFRIIHSFKGNCGLLGYINLESLIQHIETLLEKVKSGASLNIKSMAELLLKQKDILRDAVVNISENGNGEIADLGKHISALKNILSCDDTQLIDLNKPQRLGEILVLEGSISEKELKDAIEEQKKPIGQILIERGAITQEQVEDALVKQKIIKDKIKNNKILERRQIKRQDIRVNLQKLDYLIDTIGELVIAENMLVNNPDLEGLELDNFNKNAQHMNKIVRDLQELTMVIRMVPVSNLFRRMIRLVHDLSIKFNKQVDFKIEGEETEIDKTVIEFIGDPLVHLIRNALDHGIETPEERIFLEKSKIGSIKLTASQEEGEILITLEDDGKGLNNEKILDNAINKGLISGEGGNLTDDEISELIFLPGFSTADIVTDISGRGVGMDVVKKNLEMINGKISVKSKPGVGTKFIMHIPLTLAIIEGMMIRVGRYKYIIPLMSIKHNFQPNKDAITITPDGQELVRFGENFIPVIRLHKLFKIEPDQRDLNKGILMVIEARTKTICLFVDEILGQEQTVIKGLSKYLGTVNGVSGCTILGNGEVSMILDGASLIEAIN